MGKINCTSAWTAPRKNVRLHIAHHPEKLTLFFFSPQVLETAASVLTGTALRCTLLQPGRPRTARGCGFSLKKSTGAVNIFLNNLQNFNMLEVLFVWMLKNHLSLTEMPFDSPRGKTMKDCKFSCILFTGRTIHFIYKWLKITKSKQAEA